MLKGYIGDERFLNLESMFLNIDMAKVAISKTKQINY